MQKEEKQQFSAKKNLGWRKEKKSRSICNNLIKINL